MPPSDAWSPQVMIVTGSRRKGWTLTRYPLGDEEWRRTEMTTEELRLKEQAVVEHMKSGWDDGCMCEPCMAVRQIVSANQIKASAERDQLKTQVEKAEAKCAEIIGSVHGVINSYSQDGTGRPETYGRQTIRKAWEQLERAVVLGPTEPFLARLAALELLAKFVLTMPDNDDLSWWLESLTAKAREALAAASEEDGDGAER